MRKTNKMMGLIFANTHDDQIKELTVKRTMGSIPYGGRYRLIDFSISNMANAEITKVGIIARQNYMSLMDHVESGKSYGLARKNGGLFVLPPNVSGVHEIYHGHLEAIHDIFDFLEMAEEDYVVLADADVVSNIDLKDMFKQHLESGADVTIAYKKGLPPIGHGDTIRFEFDKNEIATDVTLAPDLNKKCNYSLDIAIFNKNHLMNLVEDAHANKLESISKDIYQRLFPVIKIKGYEVKNYVAVIDSMQSFFKSNIDLLDSKNRCELFQGERTVHTKVHDDNPVVYAIGTKVNNSLIADGCVVEGQVENSVIFRGVKIGKGAVVKNCVIMGDCEIGENAHIEYVCADRNAEIAANVEIKGKKDSVAFVAWN